MTKVKIAMIGLGRIGLVFANTLLRNTHPPELVAFSPKPRKRFAFLRAHPNFKYVDNEKLLLQEDFDGYIIASPSDTHFSYLKKLIPLGKPIFCEKPIELIERKIADIAQLAKQHRVAILVGFNRRFDPQVGSLKKSIANGQVGDIHILRLTSRDPAPPPVKFARTSGGLYLDMIIHDFDMMRFLTDDEPISVYSQAALNVAPTFAAFDDVDTAVTTIRTRKGILVTIDTSRKAVYGYDQRIEVFGSLGMVQMNNERDNEHTLFTRKGMSAQPLKNFFMDRYAASYAYEMEHFLRLVKGEEPKPKVSVYDAWMATRIAIAANKSRKTGREIAISPPSL